MEKSLKVKPNFILVSNIESKNPELVIKGNEQVMHARLSDAEFFYKTDISRDLNYYCSALETVSMHVKLGSVAEQSQRISKLITSFVAQNEIKLACRAGELSKFDLVTDMVGEFPELQGIIGGYYAAYYQEDEKVAHAIKEQYLPNTVNGQLPSTTLGRALAISDKFDYLVGYFGVGFKPTGEKDPYALRRSAINIIKIILDAKYNVSLQDIIKITISNYTDKLTDKNTLTEVLEYILDRMKVRYIENEIASDIVACVFALPVDNLLDIDKRIIAMQEFSKQESAKALASSNKRVRKLLLKASYNKVTKVSEKLLTEEAEKVLYLSIEKMKNKTTVMLENSDYTKVLQECATLRKDVDNFFEKTMVMVDDNAIKQNRLSLLSSLQQLFLQVADISYLQTE